MKDAYELIGSKGCGSVIVEAALALAGLPYRLTELPYLEEGPGRARLLALNPLGQVPTLVLPDGAVMTESAAMVLHIAETAPASRLAPAPGAPGRAAFLNLIVLLVAAVYPTFTFADDPAKWVGEGPAAASLKASVDARRLDILKRLDTTLAPSPFAFGDAPSGVDLYLACLTRWRPGRAWFADHTPTLVAIADAVDRHPVAGPIYIRNFTG
jgi:GST-like protein